MRTYHLLVGLNFARMTFYAFRRLSLIVQLLWVIRHGTYLAHR
jgi:hypothetical protein